MDKTGWTKVKLGDIAELKNGYSFKSSDYDIDKNGTYKIVTIKNVTGEQFISEDNYETVSFLPTNIRNHQILKKGDILISMTGNVGRVSLVRGDNYLLNQRVGLIQIKNKNIVSELYLNQVLSGQDFESTMISRGHGAAQPNIGKDDIESYELYLPPMEIQLQIAKLLTTIDNIIQSKLDESTKYQNMKTQIMNDIFANGEREQHWTKVKLGDICNIHDKKRKPVSKTDRVDGEYPYYGANGIQSYIDGYLFAGDYILVGEDGSVITENGNPVVNLAHGKFWANNHVHVIDAKPCVDFNYLYQALQLADVSVFVHGNIPKLSQGDFKNIELYLPPIEQQTMIANLLTLYDNMIDTVKKEKEDYEKIKTQMMNMIFA